ncbi:uncharacterized protein [Drosophila tropicalis]|uniref:uncharacterized protein n=1 Tax=Drosophila tropicalis TaxID=46794 RepID=UPI0035AC26B1
MPLQRTPPPPGEGAVQQVAPSLVAQNAALTVETCQDATPKRSRDSTAYSPNSGGNVPPKKSKVQPKVKALDEMSILLDSIAVHYSKEKDASGKINRSITNTFREKVARLQELVVVVSAMFHGRELPATSEPKCVNCSRPPPKVRDNKEVKKKSAQQPADKREEQPHDPAQKNNNAWQRVGASSRAARQKSGIPRRVKPEALLVQPASGCSYSEVLAMVTRRSDDKLKRVSEQVIKVRRTVKDGLLLELKGAPEDKQLLKDELKHVLGESAGVRILAPIKHAIIRELDELTEPCDLIVALANQASVDEDCCTVRSLRRGLSGSKVAVISAAEKVMRKLLALGRVRVGWSCCRIKELDELPKRCYRCLRAGHISAKCPSQVDRSNCCLNKEATTGPSMMRLNFIQVNLNHCAVAQDLLHQTVREGGYDLALVSEPYRSERNADWVSDINGKSAIWSCGTSSLPIEEVAQMEGFVRAKIGGYWVYSCYLPPSYTLARFGCIIDAISVDARGRQGVIIGGDFNAWAIEWGSTRFDARGRLLLECFCNLSVSLLNSGTRNTFSRAGAGSIVDLTFASDSIAPQSNWEVGRHYTGSDHEAIVFTVGTTRQRAEQTCPIGKSYKLESLNLHTFSSVLENLLDVRLGDADAAANSIMSTLESACDESMSHRKAYRRHHKPVCWWNDNIADVRRRCFRARRMYQRARGTPAFSDLHLDYKRCCKVLKKAIKDSKRECFLALCDSAEQDP